jgi:O-antigen/teichoic acid export membrane protein
VRQRAHDRLPAEPPRSTAHAVARGTTQLLGGLLAAKAMDFSLYLVLARRLGVEQFGRYTFALSFTLLFSIVADLGLATVFTREVSRTPQRARALLANTLIIKLALAGVTLALATLTSLLTHAPRETTLLVTVLTLSMLINSSAMLFESMLKSAGRAGIAGLSVVAQSTTALVVGLTLVFSGAGLAGAAVAYLLASLVHFVAAAWCARALWRRAPDGAGAERAPNPAPRVAWQERIALLREAAPLAVSGVFIALYFRVDTVILHVVRDEHAVGLYGGIYRFFEGFVLLSAAYRSVLFPIMARAADGPAASLGVLCRKSLRIHLLFTIGVAVFFTFQARAIVTLVLGAAYADAAPGLAVLIWALPGAYMADTLLHLLAAQRRQSAGARVTIAVAVFNVLLNLILIPRFSFVGASFATAASEALCFGLLFAVFRAETGGVGLLRTAWPPLAAGGVLAAGLALAAPLLPATTIGLLLAGILAVIVYTAALIGSGALGRSEWELALSLLPSGRHPRPLER